MSKKATPLQEAQKELQSLLLQVTTEQQFHAAKILIAKIVLELHKSIKLEVRKELIKAIEALS